LEKGCKIAAALGNLLPNHRWPPAAEESIALYVAFLPLV